MGWLGGRFASETAIGRGRSDADCGWIVAIHLGAANTWRLVRRAARSSGRFKSSGSQMRRAISKGGGNSSLAGESGKVWRRLNGHESESWTQPRRTWSHCLQYFGGQGIHREVESEGPAEKYRAVINWGNPPDEPVSPLVGQGRACYSGAKAFSFTHPLTKVIAGGTVRKNGA